MLSRSQIRLFGLVSRRERWGLSFRGCLAVFALTALAGLLFLLAIHPFLAVTAKVKSDVLVVEGWLDASGFRQAVVEYQANAYTRVFATGGPSKGTGPFTTEFSTVAHAAYTCLLANGIPNHVLTKVPCRIRDWNRTYSAGFALREWLDLHSLHPDSLNVFTQSVHARRTRLLFQKALGPAIKVGVISATTEEYPANRWWKSSEGIKEVISETAAYLYARFLFWP